MRIVFLNTFICPANSGSNYFCFKNYCSIVLLGIVDPYYKFIVVDIGSYGRHDDSGIFKSLAFYWEYVYGKTILPPKPLPGTNIPVPHVLIGDEGFALQTYLTLRDGRHAKHRQNGRGVLYTPWGVFILFNATSQF
jgi:hypothetical protein